MQTPGDGNARLAGAIACQVKRLDEDGSFRWCRCGAFSPSIVDRAASPCSRMFIASSRIVARTALGMDLISPLASLQLFHPDRWNFCFEAQHGSHTKPQPFIRLTQALANPEVEYRVDETVYSNERELIS